MANGTAAKVAAKPKGEGFFGRVMKFIRESYVETVHKSSWPTWPELRQFTLVVIFTILSVAFYIAAVDLIVKTLTNFIQR
ncbi:MAG: preprotein translocase subunit SecE [Armatimonadota bacterium]|nr:preprotein translocase subunit SecE [bacterium]